MKVEKIARVSFCDEKWLFGNPIIEVTNYNKGRYKNIISGLKNDGYNIITVNEYNKRLVDFASCKGIIVEDEIRYIPVYIENILKDHFLEFGPINLGMIFFNYDSRLAEKIVLKIAKYCRFLTLPNYPRCKRVAKKVLNENGLQINIENSLAKIKEKCDSILDVKNLELNFKYN